MRDTLALILFVIAIGAMVEIGPNATARINRWLNSDVPTAVDAGAP